MSTNWPNDSINDLPDHNPPTQEFIQDQGSFDISYPTPGEWLEPAPQLPTRPYPAAQRQGPRFTNRQLIIIGTAVAAIIAVLCGSLIAIGALGNSTTPTTARNPLSAAAATATASATLSATDNSGLPTTLPTSQPTATLAPGQPTPTTAAATSTPPPNSTATPIPTATTGSTGSFTDNLNFWGSKVIAHPGLRIRSNPLDFGCAAPTGSASGTYVEWQQTGITSLQAIGYISGSNPPSPYTAFTFSTSTDGNTFISWPPSSVSQGPSSGGWTQYTYSVNVVGLPKFVRVVWNVVTSQNGTPPPELGQMTITFQQ